MKRTFFESFYFIAEHPKFMMDNTIQTFPYGLEIIPVMVNPETMAVDDDEAKNTKLQIWLEHGPYERIKLPDSDTELNQPTHDIRLDCGADTFEEAIIEMATLIEKYY